MKVLVIAPQPFYQERGTPIAVRLAVEALSRQLPLIDREPCEVDLLVYNEGQDISIPGVNIIRAKMPRWLGGVRPGISCKKLLCDCFLFVKALLLLWRSRKQQYDVIHAVEESVFFAWFAKKMFGIPYVYDMDSSLALQLTERWWWCRPALAFLQYLEGMAIRGSVAVAPVCEALQGIAEQHGSVSTVMLRDVSLLPEQEVSPTSSDRSTLYDSRVTDDHLLALYVGNLELYQGIDLLIESFALIHRKHPEARLAIVGGVPEHIKLYQAKAASLSCDSAILFFGPRPVHVLRSLLESADIVVSPRIKGNNTPMKIYSYLHSGTALLATDLPTHRQVLDNSVAFLAAPEPAAFGNGLSQLISHPGLRRELGSRAKAVAEQLYTVPAFEQQIARLYTAVAESFDSVRRTTNMCGNV
ncbi:MAG: glycosyltransferase family 4 protein [Pseudomonadota bacterium]|jgi:glycosyltransferase involved in cell wall biosynthesis